MKQSQGATSLGYREEYRGFLEQQVQLASKSRGDRIQGGLGRAEEQFLRDVWWPTFHHFENLHAEYEVRDYTDGLRYIDFAFIHADFRIAIEIDGITTHWKDITQEQFIDHCRRQNDLTVDNWYVLRFAYADVQKNPRYCQRIVQQLVGRLTHTSQGDMVALKPLDREIIRLALTLGRPLVIRDVMEAVSLSRSSAIRHLRILLTEGWLEPAGGNKRITSYKLHPARIINRL